MAAVIILDKAIAVMRTPHVLLGDLDAENQLLAIAVVGNLEKEPWMLRSHLVPTDTSWIMGSRR
ncbi:MAG: hypothetical protein R3B67_00995 [Phycisphaerales bacterium]